MKKRMNRREFMKKGSTAAIGAGLALRSGLSMSQGKEIKSDIVEVLHEGVVGPGRKVDQEAVNMMVRAGMKNLSGSNNPWAEFLKPTDKVGLKINCLGRPLLYTHHELIKAVSNELIAFGIKPNNIIVWDRFEKHMEDCKFEFNRSAEGVRVFGTVSLDNKKSSDDPSLMYETDFDNPKKRTNNSKISYLSKIFTQECDKHINLAILKDHGLSGVTLCLKNLAYGLCGNNARCHGRKHIGPFISDFCSIPVVKKKTVLHIIDGIEACYDNGPVPRNRKVFFEPKKLWIGRDPVALDALGHKVIAAERKAQGVPSLEMAGRFPDHIQMAADKGVGVADLNKVRINKIKLG